MNSGEEQRESSWKHFAQHVSSNLGSLWERKGETIISEISEKISVVKEATGSMVTGGILVFVGFMTAIWGCILVLGTLMPLWFSAMMVAGVLLMMGGVMMGMAKRRLDLEKLRPRHSLETLEEIRNGLKEKTENLWH